MSARRVEWRPYLGCVAVLVAVIAILSLILGAALPWVLAASVLFLIGINGFRRWRERALVRRFWNATGDKDMLVVYTASPHWQPRIESEWMQRWGGRAVFFNRSLPWQKDQPEAQLWAAMAGFSQHTPLVVLTPARGRPKAVARVQALALRSLAERLEHGEAIPEFLQVAFEAA